ncbi:MAG: rhomboid family intramembrane serine protease [Clostridiales bacterium]|nr:rhomboid family intramembrane serine protease [Clostridiales bacterium]
MKNKFKIRFNSPAVLIFAILCLGALAANLMTFGGANRLLFSTYHSSLLNPMTWLRFFTHVLGHSGWPHLINNMMYILLLGPMLEEKYGWKRVVTVILLTGFVTGMINWLFFPGIALCGASGVCFAFILLSSFTGVKEGEIPVTFLLVAILYLGQQIYQGLALNDNVSQLAHILGGIVGSIAGFALVKHKKA